MNYGGMSFMPGDAEELEHNGTKFHAFTFLEKDEKYHKDLQSSKDFLGNG